MAWSGQWRTSPGYAYVHESVAAEFVAEAMAALIELFGKHPKSNPDYSRIISAREVNCLADLIDPAMAINGGRSLIPRPTTSIHDHLSGLMGRSHHGR